MKLNIPAVLPHWIGGEKVISPSVFSNINPYSLQEICQVSLASDTEVDQAVRVAQEAQKKWARLHPKQRAGFLLKVASRLREKKDELAQIESVDTGRVISETQSVDVVSAADCLEYFASLIQVQTSHFVSLGAEQDSHFAYTLNQPIGVCAGIGAWNYPLQIACWKIAPALAAGNSFIFKPSENTPLSAHFLAEIFEEVGVPKGVLSVLHGKGDLGALLVRHPGIGKVSLTGSVGTGRKIYRDCSEHLKKLSLELGGKSPILIFEDVREKIDSVVEHVSLANFYSQGEICSNGTRVFVQRALYAEFVEKLVEKAQSLKLGDPLSLDSQVGPLISEEQKRRVLGWIESAQSSGVQVACGGDSPSGNFVRPTVLTECRDELEVCKEEIFGPVVCVFPFDTEEEVLLRANNSEYGLAAGVFTAEVQRAHRVARELQAGIVWVNSYNLTPVEIPFGGRKLSGLGRENGLEALKEYTEVQTIYMGQL